jgi:hypothetical protein
MPEKQTLERAKRAKRRGKSASTQSGEFVREEIHHIREGKHGARSTKQAIAIGLSKARRAGVNLRPPAKGKVSEKTRRSAQRAYNMGSGARPRRHHEAARAPGNVCLSARAGARPRGGRSRGRRAPRHDGAPEPPAQLRPDKLYAPKVAGDVPRPPARPRVPALGKDDRPTTLQHLVLEGSQ